MTDGGHGKLQIMPSFSDFGLYDKTEPYRLHVRISNPGEVIYYGFGDRLSSYNMIIPDVYYRIKDPSGAIIVSEALLPTSGQGYISSFNQAVAGPLQITGSSGYNAKSLIANLQGDYYFEFRYAGGDRCKFKYFDITVSNSSNVAIPGRVWSKGWQFTSDNYGNSFLGKLYVYADDGIVTSINFNSMDPYVFTVFCNQNGTDPTSIDWLTNRRSKTGKYYSPQYKIFLNDPNNDLNNPTYTFPTGQLGAIVPPIGLQSSCDGSGLFTINVTKPGKVLLLLDIDPTTGAQPIDVEIPWDVVETAPNLIPWNGLNGLGQPVVDGTSFPVSVTYMNGLTNLPIYDVENNPNGFIVELIRPKPPGTPDPPLEWDDQLIPNGGQSPVGGCSFVLPTTGCHTWPTSIGDYNTINTWWYAASSSSVAADPFIEKRSPQPLGAITGLENAFCAGALGKAFSVTPDPNSTTYIWTYTGGDYVVHGSGPSVTIDFGPSATSGTLTVIGNNSNCGAGLTPSPPFSITIVPAPAVTITPSLLNKCTSDPAFTLTGGSPSGGTYTENGIPITTFNPQTATPGPHTITYTYSTPPPAICTNIATQTINVNPLPSVNLADFTDVCFNTPPFLLTNGTPPGGDYSGDGIVANILDPSVAGPGTHQITYQYITLEGCAAQTSKPIQIIPLPSPAGAISPSFPEVCQNQSTLYSINPIQNADDYLWSVTPSNAASININPTAHNEATITWDAAYSGAAAIHVKGHNSCGDGPGQILNVTIQPKPIVTVKLCEDIITTTSGRLIRMKWGLPLGGVYSGAGIDPSDKVTFNPKNSGGSGIKTITYTYTNQHLCENTATLTILVKNPPVFGQCGITSLTDVRDNMVYTTYLIGSGASSKCWMSKNLNFGTMTGKDIPQTDNCLSEKYCMHTDEAQCTNNGGLYQWDELMQFEEPGLGYQDICPPGWHVPTEAEWIQLISTPPNQQNSLAGGYLKAFPFQTVLDGIIYFNQVESFYPSNQPLPASLTAALLWTSTRDGADRAVSHGMNNFTMSVASYSSSRSNAFPVRCVKD